MLDFPPRTINEMQSRRFTELFGVYRRCFEVKQHHLARGSQSIGHIENEQQRRRVCNYIGYG